MKGPRAILALRTFLTPPHLLDGFCFLLQRGERLGCICRSDSLVTITRDASALARELVARIFFTTLEPRLFFSRFGSIFHDSAIFELTCCLPICRVQASILLQLCFFAAACALRCSQSASPHGVRNRLMQKRGAQACSRATKKNGSSWRNLHSHKQQRKNLA